MIADIQSCNHRDECAEVKRLRDVIKAADQLRQLAGQYYEEAGPCDHDVNICVCGIKAWMDEYDAARALLAAKGGE